MLLSAEVVVIGQQYGTHFLIRLNSQVFGVLQQNRAWQRSGALVPRCFNFVIIYDFIHAKS